MCMVEMWVRGIFFKQVLDYIQKNRSQTSFDLLDMKQEDFRVEDRYDFETFCKLLAKIDTMATEEDGAYITRIARETMTKEARWKMQFRKLDPKNVFMTTKRQEGRHHIADFEPIYHGQGYVAIKMAMWTKEKAYQTLWADYYRGRLEGVLELMGRKGEVKLTREFGEGQFTYDITWE